MPNLITLLIFFVILSLFFMILEYFNKQCLYKDYKGCIFTGVIIGFIIFFICYALLEPAYYANLSMVNMTTEKFNISLSSLTTTDFKIKDSVDQTYFEILVPKPNYVFFVQQSDGSYMKEKLLGKEEIKYFPLSKSENKPYMVIKKKTLKDTVFTSCIKIFYSNKWLNQHVDLLSNELIEIHCNNF